MRFEFIQITQIGVHYFKSFSRVKSTEDEKVHFFWGKELKLTQIELFSFFHFKNVNGEQTENLKIKFHSRKFSQQMLLKK